MPQVRTQHWKLFLLAILLIICHGLAKADFHDMAKYLCFIPIALICYFIFIIWPAVFREINDDPVLVLLSYLGCYLLILILFAFVYYILLESGEAFHKLSLNDSNIFDCIYYSFVTGTTLGYGDIYPETSIARIITVVEPFITAISLATLLTVLLGNNNESQISGEKITITMDPSKF